MENGGSKVKMDAEFPNFLLFFVKGNQWILANFGVDFDFGAQPSESEEVISTALGGDWEFRGIRSPQ